MVRPLRGQVPARSASKLRGMATEHAERARRAARADGRPRRARRARARDAGARRARGAARGARSLPACLRLPVLDQRQRDLLGLALVALGVFLALRALRRLGRRPRRARRSRVGARLAARPGRATLAPVALVAGGACCCCAPLLPALRPLRAGALCLFAAAHARARRRHARARLRRRRGDAAVDARAYLQAHGGVVGEALYWRRRTRSCRTSASHILVVFLLLAGVMLLTGASLAARCARPAAASSTRRACCALDARRRAGAAPPSAATAPAPRAAPVAPPEPDDGELVVRATHVEAPSLDGRERYPDLYGEEPRTTAARRDAPTSRPSAAPDAAERRRELERRGARSRGRGRSPGVARADAAELTPQGRLRERRHRRPRASSGSCPTRAGC